MAGVIGSLGELLTKPRQLREAFEAKPLVRIAGAHNGLSAKLVENAGFDGVWASGLEIATSAAVPDANILTMSDYLARAAEMNDSVSIPIIADVDTGYGNSSNVIRMVQKFEAAGIAGISMEDKLFPKVNSLFEGRQELASIGEFVGKIMAAKNAQTDPNFMVIARVEALIAGWGLEEALKRSYEYENAGADAILIHHKKADYTPIKEFIEAWNGSIPLVLVPTNYPSMSEEEMISSGKVKLVIYANHGIRAAIGAMQEIFAHIHEYGIGDVDRRLVTLKEVFELQGMPELKQAEERFLHKPGSGVHCIIPAAGDHSFEESFRNVLKDMPLLLLDIHGRPLVQRTVAALNEAGVQNISIVAGRHAEKLRRISSTTIIENPDFGRTHILDSIMRARSASVEKTLIVFSDIIFDSSIVRSVLNSSSDVTLVVDPSIKAHGEKKIRELSPDLVIAENDALDDMRVVTTMRPNPIRRIGKSIPVEEANYEFIGIAGFSKSGVKLLYDTYDELKDGSAADDPFQESVSLSKASFTDMVQELVDRGANVTALEVSSGWSEIRTFDDYRRVTKQLA